MTKGEGGRVRSETLKQGGGMQGLFGNWRGYSRTVTGGVLLCYLCCGEWGFSITWK